jgi:hypothetical protein
MGARRSCVDHIRASHGMGWRHHGPLEGAQVNGDVRGVKDEGDGACAASAHQCRSLGAARLAE